MKKIQLITFLTAVVLSSLMNAQTTYKTIKHPPASLADKNMGNTKANIELIMKEVVKVTDTRSNKWGNPKDIHVLNDRIEFTLKDQKMIIDFMDLFDYAIVVDEIAMSENNGPYNTIYYELSLKDFTFYFKMKYEYAMKLANNLYFIQQQISKDWYSSQLALFKPKADHYRDLKEKPVIPEELRKFIVQANAFNQKKQYDDAIFLYKKAIESDPTSYPAAYSNLALLSAQIHKFDAAIFYMKEYLLLEPEASDARGAQDKIYEWEAQINK